MCLFEKQWCTTYEILIDMKPNSPEAVVKTLEAR